MVSLRRRRLLGYSTGISPYQVELPRSSDNANGSENLIQNTESINMRYIPSVDVNHPKEINISKESPRSPNVSGSISSKDVPSQQFSVVGQEIKRRKRRRRKLFEDQEPCIMRGVYFKNMKWQAAIKVDKKQIHLGTVGSQEEAARLYDRAAFMCGREPNFELSEEEKQELRQYKWDEFLTMTRYAITNKKRQRRPRAGPRKKYEPLQGGDWDGEQGVGGFSASEDVEPDDQSLNESESTQL